MLSAREHYKENILRSLRYRETSPKTACFVEYFHRQQSLPTLIIMLFLFMYYLFTGHRWFCIYSNNINQPTVSAHIDPRTGCFRWIDNRLKGTNNRLDIGDE